MVTFNENIPYAEAMKRGRAQDKALLNMVADNDLADISDLKTVLKKVQEETNEILEEDKIAGL